MKKIYTTLLAFSILSLCSIEVSAQFTVASDTIRGRIDFCPRPGDVNNATMVPNDSIFYLYPANKDIDPWRYVDFYTPSRVAKRGYIMGTKLIRVEDYDIIEVERLSSHGTISFKNDDVRINISTAKVTSDDQSIRQSPNGGYIVNGKVAKGLTRGASPKLRYQSISVTIKGKSITFPKSVFEHLLEPEIDNMVVHYNPEKSIVYIIVNNGGIEAYYSALWMVTQHGVSSPYIFDPISRK